MRSSKKQRVVFLIALFILFQLLVCLLYVTSGNGRGVETIHLLDAFSTAELEVSKEKPALPVSRILSSQRPLEKRVFRPYEAYDSSNYSSLNKTKDWTRGTFCHNFLVKTFQKPISVCSNAKNAAVQCYGSPFSDHMGTCILENVVVFRRQFAEAMYDADYTKFKASESTISLLNDRGTDCQGMTVVNIRKQVESGDYVWQVVDQMYHGKRRSSLVCDKWIEEEVLFFTAHRFHVYFRLLDYFNLHKLMEDFKDFFSGRPRILWISGVDNDRFSGFDHKLFPDVNFEVLDQNDSERVCFKKVLLVPKSYSSVFYQCKMPGRVRNLCGSCDGTGLSNSQIQNFRHRVLRACAVNESAQQHNTNSSIVFISRKQYLRNANDKASHFERIMDNEASLMAGLKEHFKSYSIQKVHLEDLELCEQIRLVHNASVFFGVHGSGLVHLWWLREEASIYELEPHYELGNPTFRTLARLAGRRYKKSMVVGGWVKVHAQVSNVIRDLDQLITGQMNSSNAGSQKVSKRQIDGLHHPYRIVIL